MDDMQWTHNRFGRGVGTWTLYSYRLVINMSYTRVIPWWPGHPRHGLLPMSSCDLVFMPCQYTRDFWVSYPCHCALPIMWHLLCVDILHAATSASYTCQARSNNIESRVHFYSSHVIIPSCSPRHGANVVYIGVSSSHTCIKNDYLVYIYQLHHIQMSTNVCHFSAHLSFIYDLWQ